MLPQLQVTDWATTLMGEILVANLLGKVLYNYPDRHWLQTLADEDIFAELPLGNTQPDCQAGLVLLQRWTSAAAQGGVTAEVYDSLCADYTRLMIGPGKVVAPPWESVYVGEERLLFQERTLQVRSWYLRFGFKIPNLYKEPDDHIGLELSFVGHLAGQALAALEQQNQSAFDELLASQRQFLSSHLRQFAPRWCKLVLEHANTEFFRGISLLTSGALAEFGEIMQIPETIR